MTDQPKKPNLPALPNDSLKNRLIALADAKFSLQSLGTATGRSFVKAMKALGAPVSRRYMLPGEANDKIAAARQRLAAMPRGTKGLYRTDGTIIVAGQHGDILDAAIRDRLDLSDLYMPRASLAKRNLRGLSVPRADLRLVDLTRATLDNANLAGADLRRAQLKRLQATMLNAEGSNFDEARIYAGWFNSGNFKNASFKGATFSATEFNACDLRGTDFTDASFNTVYNGTRWYVEMKNADLRGAKFSVNANFAALDLSGAKLDGVIIVDRDGQPINGAKLMDNGTILYHELRATPDTPRLPGA